MEKHDILKASFEATYDELIEPIFGFLYKRLGDRERSRELAQETFMKTWMYLRNGNEIQNRKAFLYATARNLFKNEIRAKRPILSLEMLQESSHFDISSQELDSESALEGARIAEMVDILKPEYREALTMRYKEGLSVTDIAKQLGEAPNVISVRIHRALQKLKVAYRAE